MGHVAAEPAARFMVTHKREGGRLNPNCLCVGEEERVGSDQGFTRYTPHFNICTNFHYMLGCLSFFCTSIYFSYL